MGEEPVGRTNIGYKGNLDQLSPTVVGLTHGKACCRIDGDDHQLDRYVAAGDAGSVAGNAALGAPDVRGDSHSITLAFSSSSSCS